MKALHNWTGWGTLLIMLIFSSLEGEAWPDYVQVPPEQISLGLNETRQLEVPFPIEKIQLDNPRIAAQQKDVRTVEISGKQVGSTVLKVHMQGLVKSYHVTVFNALWGVYREIVQELVHIPEISAQIQPDAIVLHGEISDPEHWTHFKQLLASYPSQCRSFVRFTPSSALLINLKKQLQEAGFQLTEDISPDTPNGLKLSTSPETLSISGYLYCASELVRLQKLLARQKWLQPEWNGHNYQVVTDLKIADVQFDIGISFIGISRSQLKQLGNSQADGTILSWDVIAWFRSLGGDIFPDGGSTQNAQGTSSYLNATLKGSLRFFGDNGISDFRDGGHVTLTNNSPTPAVFENGGTLNVKLIGQESVDLKEINYGLKLKVQGNLIRPNVIQLNLEVEKSLAPVRTNDDYLQRKTKSSTQLRCPLGKTAIIAGQQEYNRVKNGPTGYAFWRNVPVVNWFLSYEETSQNDLQLFILVYPQIITKSPHLTQPDWDVTPTDRTVNKNQEQSQRELQQQENLNWFQKMFIW